MTPQQATAKYFELLGLIEQAERAGDYAGMLRHCFNSLPLLELFVRHVQAEFGDFDVGSIPAIETACKYLAVANDQDGITKVERVVDRIPELQRWQATIDEARRTAAASLMIFEFVRVNPDCIQSQLGAATGLDTIRVRTICYYLTKTGNLQRERAGRSYALRVASD